MVARSCGSKTKEISMKNIGVRGGGGNKGNSLKNIGLKLQIMNVYMYILHMYMRGYTYVQGMRRRKQLTSCVRLTSS